MQTVKKDTGRLFAHAVKKREHRHPAGVLSACVCVGTARGFLNVRSMMEGGSRLAAKHFLHKQKFSWLENKQKSVQSWGLDAFQTQLTRLMEPFALRPPGRNSNKSSFIITE